MIDASWRNEALCRGKYNEIDFFDYSPGNVIRVRQHCVDCPVFEQCVNWATHEIDIDEIPEGIFAGYTPGQRFKIAGGLVLVDWRKFFKKHPNCRECGDVMMSSGRRWYCSSCTFSWQQPVRYERVDPDDKARREAERIANRPVPECPDCRTKKDVIKYRTRKDGVVLYRHLPCGKNYSWQEAAA